MPTRSPKPTKVDADTMTEGPAEGGLFKERAYAALKQRILTGEYSVDSFLSQRQIALDLSMSKTPVRAAVERLEMEGFLSISPQQGIIVRELSVHEIADQYEIRMALETFVLRQLAGRLTRDQIDKIEANLAAQDANRRNCDVALGVRLDFEFHLLFCEFTGNAEFRRVMRHLQEKIHRVISRVFQQNPGRVSTSSDDHRAIADALIRGDGPEAVRLIEDHLEYGKRSLLNPRGALNSTLS